MPAFGDRLAAQFDVIASDDIRPAILAVVGSHAYGTQHELSDVDIRGVYTLPTQATWSLRQRDETISRSEPDVVVHELEKFARLAAAANPTVLEVLWADDFLANEDGELLREHRQAFLSRRVMKTYGGYALSQLAKAKAGTGGSRGVQHLRREKFFLHTVRLMEAGLHAIETGDLRVKVAHPEALRYLAAGAAQDSSALEAYVSSLDERMNHEIATSPLPQEPDWSRIDHVLTSIRLRNL